MQVRWHPASETHRFKTGLADLDETARMLETLFELDLKDDPDVARLRRAAHDRLARAFLNRADDALRAGLPELARDALRKGFHCSPRVIKTILGDPRLCVKMAALTIAPRLARAFRTSPTLTPRRAPIRRRPSRGPSVSADKLESTVPGEDVRDRRMRRNGRLAIRAFPRRSPIRPLLETIAEMSDRQFISHPHPAEFHAFSVDSNAIRAAQITNEDLSVLVRYAAMMARDTK